MFSGWCSFVVALSIAALAGSAAAQTSSVIIEAGSTPEKPLEVLDTDYPFDSLLANEEGTVKLTFTIDSEGRPANIRILSTSGVPRLDQEAGYLAQTRWKFEPSAANGTFRVAVNWKLPLQPVHDFDIELPPAPADATPIVPTTSQAVQVEDYPSLSLRNGEGGIVGLRYAVSEDGAVVNAEVAKSSGSKRLDDAAVRMIIKRWRFESGGVHAVHSVTVAFRILPSRHPLQCYAAPIHGEESASITATLLPTRAPKRVIDRWVFVSGMDDVSDLLLGANKELVRPSAPLIALLKGAGYSKPDSMGCWYYDPILLNN